MRARRQPRQKREREKGERSCVSCRKRGLRGEFLRWVLDGEKRLWADPYLKAPGRGAHICISRECLAQAAKRRAFSRAFRSAVEGEQAESLLKGAREAIQRRIDDQLALARRRGAALSGNEQISRYREEIPLLIIAHDCADDTARKLSAKTESAELLYYGDRSSLGKSQGKSDRVSVAITHALLAEALSRDIRHLDHLLVAS